MQAKADSLYLVEDSVVDRAITIVGKWGTYINGKSYQQEALVTHNGWQYTTYYDAQRRLAVARRKWSDGVWKILRFEDYIYENDDNHNVTVIGICPDDGTIHLAFDHHGDDLHYRTSLPGVVDNPDNFEWNASLFGPTRSDLIPGQPLSRVTYPRFVSGPNDKLYLMWRNGKSSDGRIWMNEYSHGAWEDPWQITSSDGSYACEGIVSQRRNAYTNGFAFDRKTGRMHFSWIWREGDELRNTQHDLMYACSSDLGRTWFNAQGDCVGDALISIDSPVTVWEIDGHRGMKNQHSMYVDNKGRPHIVLYYLQDGESDLALGKKDEQRSRYYHFYLDLEGTWHRREVPIPVSTIGNKWRHRARVILGRNNTVYLVFNLDGDLGIACATDEADYRDWQLAVRHADGRPYDGEPRVDVALLESQGKLSIYIQKEASSDHEATPLHVVTFEIG